MRYESLINYETWDRGVYVLTRQAETAAWAVGALIVVRRNFEQAQVGKATKYLRFLFFCLSLTRICDACLILKCVSICDKSFSEAIAEPPLILM